MNSGRWKILQGHDYAGLYDANGMLVRAGHQIYMEDLIEVFNLPIDIEDMPQRVDEIAGDTGEWPASLDRVAELNK